MTVLTNSTMRIYNTPMIIIIIYQITDESDMSDSFSGRIIRMVLVMKYIACGIIYSS